jgi:hypothetical protein
MFHPHDRPRPAPGWGTLRHYFVLTGRGAHDLVTGQVWPSGCGRTVGSLIAGYGHDHPVPFGLETGEVDGDTERNPRAFTAVKADGSLWVMVSGRRYSNGGCVLSLGDTLSAGEPVGGAGVGHHLALRWAGGNEVTTLLHTPSLGTQSADASDRVFVSEPSTKLWRLYPEFLDPNHVLNVVIHHDSDVVSESESEAATSFFFNYGTTDPGFKDILWRWITFGWSPDEEFFLHPFNGELAIVAVMTGDAGTGPSQVDHERVMRDPLAPIRHLLGLSHGVDLLEPPAARRLDAHGTSHHGVGTRLLDGSGLSHHRADRLTVWSGQSRLAATRLTDGSGTSALIGVYLAGAGGASTWTAERHLDGSGLSSQSPPTRLVDAGGVHRVADTSLQRYELFHGVDAAPDFSSPTATAPTLPLTLGPLSYPADHQIVLRRRNAYGLSSQNTDPIVIRLDADGRTRLPPPSAPTVRLEVTPTGVDVVAAYDAALDPSAERADQLTLRLSTTGPAAAAPPSILTPTSVDDRLAVRVPVPLTAPMTVAVLVRTRRSVDGQESVNTDEATLTLSAAPAAPSARALIGRQLGLRPPE